MDILRQVRKEYELSSLEWIKENEVFQSDSGKKRVRIWEDKELLQWHVKWRDDISRQSGILLDRMIRTKQGDPFILCENSFVTIHDEIEEAFPFGGREKKWGRLIGTTLAVGLEQSNDCQCLKPSDDLTLNSVMKSDHKLQHLDPMARLVFERSYFEAKSRIRKAEALQERIHPTRLPILTTLSTSTNARQVFSNLFWVCGSKQPEKGYKPLATLLLAWFEKNGETSTVKLLNEINHFSSLKGDQGKLLLTECLLPYEFEKAIDGLTRNKNESDLATIIDLFFKEWESARLFVLLLSNWIEKDEEKAVAK